MQLGILRLTFMSESLRLVALLLIKAKMSGLQIAFPPSLAILEENVVYSGFRKYSDPLTFHIVTLQPYSKIDQSPPDQHTIPHNDKEKQV